MEGDVVTADIGSDSIIIIWGKYPTPRGWAGEGRYKEYIFNLSLLKTCLMNPKSPVLFLSKSRQLEREPLGHLGMSRGDGRGACERTWSS
jgi:hypothetical protein